SEACDFEHRNLCEWYQPTATMGRTTTAHTAHVFQWAPGKGASIHPGEENHRPLTDHTMATREGWYLYADSSNGNFGHTAEIITPVVSQTGPKCKMVFWNYMNGATVGSLEVLIKVGNMTTRLWAQSGPQGPQWNRAEVFLGVRSYFQVLFRAKRGISYVGDVAVDDISFKDCSPLVIPEKPCTSEELTCANKYCIPEENLCDFVDDCADNSDESDSICSVSIGRCNFEFDLCEWEQDQNDDFDWNLRNGGLPRAGTGPIADHSLQEPSGHYIFIKNFFPQLPGQEATISSVIISRKSKNCKIIFYYHMYGENIGSLTVYQETVSNHSKILFTLSGDQGNFWNRKVLPLEADEDFRVIFEGRVGTAYRRSITLDDIVFTRECLLSSNTFSEEPTELPVTGACSPGYFECLNGKCYRAEQRCNFEDDCGDNTDERECGTSCTFENEMCGWRNSHADNFDWIMGTNLPQSLVPSKDHTLGNRQGVFLSPYSPKSKLNLAGELRFKKLMHVSGDTWKKLIRWMLCCFLRHFLYLRAKSTGIRGEKAHLMSSMWTESSTACTLHFWYYMSSKATGCIHVLIKRSYLIPLTEERYTPSIWDGRPLPPSTQLREGCTWSREGGRGHPPSQPDQPNQPWRSMGIDFTVLLVSVGEDPGVCPADTDFVCWNKKCIESHLVCDYKPDCKDWSDEADCSQYTSVRGSCNFETQGQDWTTACGFTQDPGDELDWHIGNRTVIEQEDLSRDHTPGNGHNFLYVNSSTRQEGRAKIVTTRAFPASLGICRLRFWFWMCSSPNIGILKVFTVEEFGMDLLMWAATGKQSRTWSYANVLLSSNRPFKVAFEAEAGANQAVEFALDDISFTPECESGGFVAPQPPTCNSGQFTCVYVKQCVALTAKCNRMEDCADGSDEMACPTENPTAASPRLCKDTEFQCANQLCIPSLLRCDGVPDCMLNEDEANCSIKDCSDGSLLCPSTNSCIPVSQLCDGIADCIDFAPDESSCSDTWTGLGIGLAFLLIEIAVTVSCILSKRKLQRMKPEELSNTAFDNPLYEAQSVK
ncbi:hypothetical protein JRQ81_018550, partial [Phrynocephalus forsythii]